MFSPEKWEDLGTRLRSREFISVIKYFIVKLSLRWTAGTILPLSPNIYHRDFEDNWQVYWDNSIQIKYQLGEKHTRNTNTADHKVIAERKFTVSRSSYSPPYSPSPPPPPPTPTPAQKIYR